MILLSLGLVGLLVGAELVLRGVRKISRVFGISKTVVGFTLLAVSTSLPEFFVAITSSIFGFFIPHFDNFVFYIVIASFVFQGTLMVGLVGLIRKVKNISETSNSFTHLFWISFILFILSMDGVLGRADGLILIAAYLYHLANLDSSRTESAQLTLGFAGGVVWIFAGMLALGFSAVIAVMGAVGFVSQLGFSLALSGVLIAVGTSLSELAVSIIQSVAKKGDVALATLIGSNIFTLAIPLGFASLIRPFRVDPILSGYVFIISIFTYLSLKDKDLVRWEAVVFGLLSLPFLLMVFSL